MGSPGLRLLWSCRPSRRQLVRAVTWSVLEAAPGALSGVAVAHAVDAFRGSDAARGVFWLAALAVAILLGAVGTRGLYAALAPAVEETRDRLMTTLVEGSIAQLATTGRSGSAPLTQLIDQVDQVRNLLAALARSIRSTLAPLAGALVGIFALSPRFGLTVAALTGTALLAYTALLAPMLAAERDAARADEHLGTAATAALEGAAAVRGLGAEPWTVRYVSAAALDTGRADLRVARMHAWRHVVIAIGGYAPLLAVLAMAGPLVREDRVSVGDVVGATTYLVTALLPALSASITGSGGWLVTLTVLLDRLALVATVPAPLPVRVPVGPDSLSAFSARGATFSYRTGARPIVENLTVSLAPGQLMALVGPSGAGKTTLAHLGAGLLSPTEGDIGLGSDHRLLLLPQTPYVFGGTVRENLRYLAKPDPDDSDLWAALEVMGLRAVVDRLGGLEAAIHHTAARSVGDASNGHRLSAGERQRLVLARAWLSDADVLLLDEAWSLLEASERRRIETSLLAAGRSLVVVSHHLDVASRANLVAYFDGRDVHTGHHRELLATCAAYRELVTFA